MDLGNLWFGVDLKDKIKDSDIDKMREKIQKGLKESVKISVDAKDISRQIQASLKSEVFNIKLGFDEDELRRKISATVSRAGANKFTASDLRAVKAQTLMAQSEERLNGLRAQTRQRTANAESAEERLVAARIRTQAANNRLQQSQRQLNEALSQGSKSADFLNSTLAKLGGVTALTLLGRQIVKTAGDFQFMEAAITSLVGSEREGAELMEQLKDFARISPLEVKDVTKAAQTLLGFNVELARVPDMIQRLGDVSMGNKDRFNALTLAFAQTTSAARLTGEDLRQYVNAGFNPLQVMAEKTGKTMEELKDEMGRGAISVQMVEQAFIDATSAGGKFYRMSEKQSDTINGQLAKLGDTIDRTLNEIGRSNESIITGGISLTSKLITNYEQIGRIILGLATTYGIYRTAVLLATAAENGYSIATGLAKIRILAVAKAQAVLNTTMLINPYVLAATALGAVVGALIAANDGMTAAERAQRNFNDAMEEAAQKQKDYNDETERAIGTANDDMAATEERRLALNLLIDRYGDIMQKYIDEKGHLKDILQLKKEIAIIDGNRNVESLNAKAGRYNDAAEAARMLVSGKPLTQAQQKLIADMKEEYFGENGFWAKAWYNDNDLLDWSRRMAGEYGKKARREAAVNAATRFQDTIAAMNDAQLEALRKLLKSAKQKNGNVVMKAYKELANVTLTQEDIDKLTTFAGGIMESRKPKARTKHVIEEDKKAAQAQLDALTVAEANGKKGAELRKKIIGYTKELESFNPKTSNNTSNKDTELEAAKTKLQQYKSFLSEYKKYRELYDKEKAISKLGDLFPDLKDEQGNFLGLQLVDNYTEVLDKLRDSLPATTEARKKFLNDIDKTSADTVFDREKESIKKNAKAMDEYAKKMQDQWKLYRSLLSKSGGNREFASLAFNDNGILWDDVSKKMLEDLNKRGEELGVIPIELTWDMNEEELKVILSDANGQVQTELVKLALDIQDIIRGNYRQFLEDSAEAYNKALSNADKVLDIERQLAELEKARSQYNGNDKAVIDGYDAQIKAKRRELEQAKSDALKESNDYLNFYNAILTLTIPEAERIGQAIKENLNLELKAGRLSARQYLAEIKNINKQMNELRNKKSGLGAFLSGGLNGYIDNMKQQGDSQWQRGVNDLQASEKSFEKAVEIYNKASSAGDVKGMDAANAQMQASENAMASAKSMMASGEAMSNAAGEAGSTVAVIDKIIHGIDGIVQGMKGTFDEIREMYDALGHNTDTEEWNEWGTFFNSFSEASSNATKGWDSLKNGDIGGVIQGVVGSWTSWFTGISRGWDAKMDRRIKLAEEQLEATNRMREAMEMAFERTLGGVFDYKTTKESIDKLAEARDRTEEIDEKTYGERWRSSAKAGLAGSAIGGAIGMVAGPIGAAVGAVIGGVLGNIFGAKTRKFTVNYYSEDTIKKMDEAIKSQSYYDEQLALLFKQRDELQHQLAAEQEKKDIDNEKVEDYKTQIAEVKDQIDNFAQDLAKTLWDIDVRDWASQLGDALFEAWQKGENGAMAFKKKAAEIISDLAKNIATKKLVEVAMKPVLDAITSEMERTDGLLDSTSMERISNSLSVVGNTLPSSFNTLLDSIEEGAKRAGLGTLKGSDTSSSASAGIKSITEQKADLLASYGNAIRADVSVIRAEQSVHLPSIAAAIQRTSVLAETQVTHLQQIASNTQRNADAADRIYDIMHKIDIGVTKIKVA